VFSKISFSPNSEKLAILASYDHMSSDANDAAKLTEREKAVLCVATLSGTANPVCKKLETGKHYEL